MEQNEEAFLTITVGYMKPKSQIYALKRRQKCVEKWI